MTDLLRQIHDRAVEALRCPQAKLGTSYALTMALRDIEAMSDVTIDPSTPVTVTAGIAGALENRLASLERAVTRIARLEDEVADLSENRCRPTARIVGAGPTIDLHDEDAGGGAAA
jgi:hypothetical protein